ncbi:Ubiquinol--cytochrome c reductase, cytochrome B subunit [Pseudonocardia sp. Ae168_Ps1]|uniref:cytochrome bc1 complex cytochrome b subunit n=1 Tax=unclassified Pseudonocardia TaxID=2619320 RepID=UPI00095E9B84|nr:MULTISPECIES: cytochrome bc complex cytochrome b subunit [unclassified Pseudonocardia]OLL72956.1 Ubiquinol--cytochrome c reductase, cytochrome B subunit [Pseudonocardia sp. Ae150A_Ps1]OLL78932.1 Ubiquinol--cytochrome c reductase, cytochrome B subunit [Pseudonocardia sp. Ae168_Ps1]OLL86930.1 Ubiquinol--cytochrome c reductase, cytochrome B subunit [Pseudonocardia sp. Ae263_Ps1]OLL93025.1 Ubiquinol--cytochrome c reductase, cytochrome B subunit [Pseudonocardia sp. Ae356_Ps1]
MSSITTPRSSSGGLNEKGAEALDQRFHPAAGLRKQFNKVFPTHWSFMLGEIALYSFIIVILSGIYLALFFDPSMEEIVYNGPYDPLRGVHMSRAYESALEISFEVRGGLFMRQLHHWAALLFVASMIIHMFRVFFTGAFRKPREANWTIGIVLILLGTFAGFTGYSLPDDLLSGVGLRIASGITLTVPIMGTWVHWALFGGEFPGTEIIPRLYILHVLVLPGIILALIAVHLGLVWYQKHTQFPGPGRTEKNVVGVRILPQFAAKGGAFFAVVAGVLALIAGQFQINGIWHLGPYDASHISAGSQPDFYMLWSEGMGRIFPPWEFYLFGEYTIPAAFIPTAGFLPVLFVVAGMYPALERRFTGDDALHNLLQRPRDVPVRTALGAMAISFYLWLVMCGFNDWISYFFHISLNATTWAGRLGLMIVPPIVYWVTYRWCLGLQKSDRAVLEHGIETGIIKRLPHGEFIEVHQPLAGVDSHGHAIELDYQGTSVPKRMNQLGSAGEPVPGSLMKPDPAEESRELAHARHEAHERELTERDERAAARRELESRREELAGRPDDGGRPQQPTE